MNLTSDLLVLLPELILALGAMALLLACAVLATPPGTPAGSEKPLPVIGWASVLLLTMAGVAVVIGPGQASAFHDAFVADGFSRFAKLLILVGAALSILLADEFFSTIQLSRFELPVVMLLATLTRLLVAGALGALGLGALGWGIDSLFGLMACGLVSYAMVMVAVMRRELGFDPGAR